MLISLALEYFVSNLMAVVTVFQKHRKILVTKSHMYSQTLHYVKLRINSNISLNISLFTFKYCLTLTGSHVYVSVFVTPVPRFLQIDRKGYWEDSRSLDGDPPNLGGGVRH